MSLARFVTRLLTRRALETANTIAEDRVKDSSIVDLEQAVLNAPLPVILVYTDDSDFAPVGREIYGGQGTTTIVLILAIAGAVTLESGETEFRFPFTDETTEMSLDFLERQIQVALTDPDNPWAQLWQGMVSNVTRWQSRRGASTKEGARFGARQILLEVETAFDPPAGGEPEGIWAEVIEAIRGDQDQDFAGLADPLEAMVRGRGTSADWKRIMAFLAVPRKSLKGMGLAPVHFHSEGEGDEEPALLTRITVMPGNISSDDEAAQT